MIDFAKDMSDARVRYEAWRKNDPFPEIMPALLNSADIYDYVLNTSMIWPFNIEQLKSAAYEMMLGNEFLYWDEHGKEVYVKIEDHDGVVLKQNSIMYVTIKETFMLPDYIALRFNFTINHVHRGLLLGTGPLVNPGFDGKLMIPIHNLTPNTYYLRPGDPLISVEFTKLSPCDSWRSNSGLYSIPKRRGSYITKRKKGLPFKEYLKKALPVGTEKVESSLSHALDSANRQITGMREMTENDMKIIKDDVKKELDRAALQRKIVTGATMFGIISIVVMTWQIFQSNQQYISQLMMVNKRWYEVLTDKEKVEFLEKKIAVLKKEDGYRHDAYIRARLDTLEQDIHKMYPQIYDNKK